ncbi:MAG TPA: transcription antitermination factor NusB [Candidatus Kapabacteria bacterium]|jgi:transcription antitermination factor NusB|nr:transcription antitermination factor NusB [Candidatus Kapabacteria bacterium]
MLLSEIELYPLSKSKKITGSRRLVREKVLQILVAFEVSGSDLDFLFTNIFYRDYTFEPANPPQGVLLKPEQIIELESDIPIRWKEDNINFAKSLINASIELRDFTIDLIKEEVRHWEIERIALIDRILINMALAEFINFPEIPEKVTINEIIEISKNYSTDKSNIFINGLLDNFRKKLKEQGKIKKSGKGLLEK